MRLERHDDVARHVRAAGVYVRRDRILDVADRHPEAQLAAVDQRAEAALAVAVARALLALRADLLRAGHHREQHLAARRALPRHQRRDHERRHGAGDRSRDQTNPHRTPSYLAQRAIRARAPEGSRQKTNRRGHKDPAG
jgi:hypothetical protein